MLQVPLVTLELFLLHWEGRVIGEPHEMTKKCWPTGLREDQVTSSETMYRSIGAFHVSIANSGR